mgnify:FL=1
MKKLSEIFEIDYPNTNIFYKNVPDKNGINFVSAKATDNGIAGRVKFTKEFKIYPAKSITVPLKGSVLEPSLQTEKFYCAHQIAVLTPLIELKERELLFYVYCIKKNKFKFNYGRQADRTFKNLLVPELNEIPKWVYESEYFNKKINFMDKFKLSKSDIKIKNVQNLKLVKLKDLFDISYGNSLDEYKCTRIEGGISFVSRSSKNNGIVSQVMEINGEKINEKYQLTFAASGSVGATFLQPNNFYTSYHIFILKPKFEMNFQELLYFATALKLNEYKFNYGRQANRSLPDLLIPSYESIPSWIYKNYENVFNNTVSHLNI